MIKFRFEIKPTPGGDKNYLFICASKGKFNEEDTAHIAYQFNDENDLVAGLSSAIEALLNYLICYKDQQGFCTITRKELG